MPWGVIRRMRWTDYDRAIPRLEKFCRRHEIEFPYPESPPLTSDREKLSELMHVIRCWTEEPDYDYRASGTSGQRMQMARRVWQRAVRESRADFGLVSGTIGYHVK